MVLCVRCWVNRLLMNSYLDSSDSESSDQLFQRKLNSRFFMVCRGGKLWISLDGCLCLRWQFWSSSKSVWNIVMVSRLQVRIESRMWVRMFGCLLIGLMVLWGMSIVSRVVRVFSGNRRRSRFFIGICKVVSRVRRIIVVVIRLVVLKKFSIRLVGVSNCWQRLKVWVISVRSLNRSSRGLFGVVCLDIQVFWQVVVLRQRIVVMRLGSRGCISFCNCGFERKGVWYRLSVVRKLL